MKKQNFNTNKENISNEEKEQSSEQKKNAQLFVQQKFDIKATQDECDAICIGSHILIGKKPIPDHDWS